MPVHFTPMPPCASQAVHVRDDGGSVMSVGGLNAWMSVFGEDVVHGLLKLVSRRMLY